MPQTPQFVLMILNHLRNAVEHQAISSIYQHNFKATSNGDLWPFSKAGGISKQCETAWRFLPTASFCNAHSGLSPSF